ncbi:Na/Pi cotransporter family protein [Hydrogenoanaerobacterium saccharovorans]|uniref:Na/Pi cotransporter family protein n=2 Tax=Hydrogenoanaerobacterium saccharovorans TaxID=474960 RepID=A0ABS2GR04_9FIRM|nr:Na/Pi cotransporter family protein [Hydrogenoanaerobacterium saccharovorans]
MIVSLLGGLALFLYGMSMLGSGLEKLSGGRLEQTLEKLTNNVFKGVLLGALVTGAIQSSSATTVIVVGLVNARILKLRQAIGIIMGANIGTTVTAHILRLSDLSSDNFFLMLLKPTTLAPVVGIIGILMVMVGKKQKYKTLGEILLGFCILFTGMFNMEAAVSPLSESPEFAGLFASLSNPVIGVLVGTVVTAIIQSSSASIGILQALSSTGIITWSSAIPIILGQNIGTCITPILASIGASKNAKRTAAVHLSFNIIGTCVFLIVIYTIQSISPFSFWDLPIDKGGIANFHTTFNVCVTLMFLPFVGLLEKLVIHLIPDQQTAGEVDDPAIALDDRLLASPGLAIQHCRDAVLQMGKLARKNFSASVRQLEQYNHKEAEKIREREDTIDRLEDRLGNYMLKIPQDNLSEQSSATISALLHILSEFERIGDYSINLVEFAENMESTGAEFSPQAQFELTTIGEAVGEAIDMALGCFEKQDLALAETIEPLEEVVDQMQETLKDRHINRLRNGQCTVDAAFPFVESLSCLERISDHCSNIGVYMISYVRGSDEVDHHTYIMQLHAGQVGHYNEQFRRYTEKYYDQIRSAKA